VTGIRQLCGTFLPFAAHAVSSPVALRKLLQSAENGLTATRQG